VIFSDPTGITAIAAGRPSPARYRKSRSIRDACSLFAARKKQKPQAPVARLQDQLASGFSTWPIDEQPGTFAMQSLITTWYFFAALIYRYSMPSGASHMKLFFHLLPAHDFVKSRRLRYIQRDSAAWL
jgi:hypothetical protein